MQDLHAELTNTDNRVAFSRQAYSDAVMHYNTYREQFLFEIEEEEIREPVRVSFSKAA